jgi:hypothetical protein
MFHLRMSVKFKMADGKTKTRRTSLAGEYWLIFQGGVDKIIILLRLYLKHLQTCFVYYTKDLGDPHYSVEIRRQPYFKLDNVA